MSARMDNVSMGFTGETFPAGTHMCLIYGNEDERAQIIARFMEGGLRTGERVAYFSDTSSPDEVKHWLQRQGVELPAAGTARQFSVSATADTYHPGGEFVPEKMLARLRTFYDQARAEEYPACRVSGEMSWALKGVPGAERLMEYESKANEVFKTHPVTAICQYDARKFDGATILECLKVHPYMIVRGQILRNPYYLTPEEYVKTLPPRAA